MRDADRGVHLRQLKAIARDVGRRPFFLFFYLLYLITKLAPAFRAFRHPSFAVPRRCPSTMTYLDDAPRAH